MAKMRTDLSRARGTGATGTGTDHFWQQRLTGIANVVLLTSFVILLVHLHDKDYATVRAAFHNPLVGIVMALTIVSATVHMRLGMQTIIEDYAHGHTRLPMQILSNFFAIVVAVASLFAILKLSFGA
ncbi:succinate dehydrogenase, hydrophobic membrane anchor protein [Aureimonas leprariae]|uniref:Succinate dehydrogenase hydrophobic membrane anchor subunit n=1 Tax=Plantimonas leprariae TaxID=2615207 RepID=A0A7V7U100_9HYPH|nr:succinate dehydrogenase, hydrophobic membrane anchor protein [Aureimonas leprariae]KAB0681272.1 succinate dehydrogenase, hydrophobic membrane anchor protein [Aureimonas leprariae]